MRQKCCFAYILTLANNVCTSLRYCLYPFRLWRQVTLALCTMLGGLGYFEDPVPAPIPGRTSATPPPNQTTAWFLYDGDFSSSERLPLKVAVCW
jgi:hypothetical protein